MRVDSVRSLHDFFFAKLSKGFEFYPKYVLHMKKNYANFADKIAKLPRRRARGESEDKSG